MERKDQQRAVFLQSVEKHFDAGPVLSGITLDVADGEFLSVVGVSGCGKTTLLRIIGGLERASSGQVLVYGEPVVRASRKTGFVFQDHRLLPWLTVEGNIKLALDHNTPDQDGIVRQNLELVKLQDFGDSYPRQLSGGMAQRVSIARALANRPRLLLLDEPFGALDAMTRIHMQQALREIWQKEKITMILITHDVEEAIYLGERVVVLSSRPGRIKQIVDIPQECHQTRTGKVFHEIRDQIYSIFFKGEDFAEKGD